MWMNQGGWLVNFDHVQRISREKNVVKFQMLDTYFTTTFKTEGAAEKELELLEAILVDNDEPEEPEILTPTTTPAPTTILNNRVTLEP